MENLSEYLSFSLSSAYDPVWLQSQIFDRIEDKNSFDENYEALKKLPRRVWEQYLADNPDITESSIDPVTHYIRHGSHEGRKVYAFPPDEGITPERPKVSLIIPNYNNALFLGKCLESAACQSLREMEIILVDDCSTDSSVTLATSVMKGANSFRLLRNSCRQSQHMARKSGVEAARGTYIMFLDSDDFLAPNACEIAWMAASGGYDMVCFGTHIVPHGQVAQERIAWLDNFLNGAQPGEYSSRILLTNIFIHKKGNFTIWNKIYRAELCKEAFACLENGYLPRGQDLYQFIAITSRAKKIYIIDDKLYYYRFGNGVSNPGEDIANNEQYFRIGDIWKYLERYCEKYYLGNYARYIRDNLLANSFSQLMKIRDPDRFTHYFSRISSQYDDIFVLEYLVEKYFYRWDEVAERFAKPSAGFFQKTIRRIGIFYHRLSYGGVQTVIKAMCAELIRRSYAVILFVEEVDNFNPEDFSNCVICRINPSTPYTKENVVAHLRQFQFALKHKRVDVLFYHAGSSPALLWDLLLCRQLGTDVVVQLHECFSHGLTNPQYRYGYMAKDTVYALAPKVLCLSSYAELYLRGHGIDAEYLANPIAAGHGSTNITERPNQIMVMARLDDNIKQTGEWLRILAEVKKEYSNAQLMVIGDFRTDEQRQNFYKRLETMNLADNILMAGWQPEPNKYIAQCNVCLSTSYSEGFPLNIGEALAGGLPCVIYDLPIMLARDNKAVITVPQRDVHGAAREICRLWRDKTLLTRLSREARNFAARFSQENYGNNLAHTLARLGKSSPWRIYTTSEAQITMSAIVNHARRGLSKTTD